MPKYIVYYVAGLLMVAGRATCTRMARVLNTPISHDTLTRALHSGEEMSQALLMVASTVSV